MRILLDLIPFICISGFVRHGNRQVCQRAGLVLILRLALEKKTEWTIPLIVVPTDVLGWFDMTSPALIGRLQVHRQVPLRLMFALLRGN